MIQPTPAERKEYLLRQCARYWPTGREVVDRLPIPDLPLPDEGASPPATTMIPLPSWGADCGVEGELLAPTFALIDGEGEPWRRVDWFAVLFWYLNGWDERRWEAEHGPGHSYAFRLPGWDRRLWERAWVNRIALFLRRWGASINETDERGLFGQIPSPRLLMTHDLDAVRKTPEIRFKQSVFHMINAGRRLLAVDPAGMAEKLSSALSFALRSGDFWFFDTIRRMEEERGLTSHLFVYGGPPGLRRGIARSLFDPAYDVADPRLSDTLRRLSDDGWIIGLHGSFYSWNDPAALRRERERIEAAIGRPVTSNRQHWLKFGLNETWPAQEKAGLTFDCTFGFNDRSGFRNGAALAFTPWNETTRGAGTLVSWPMILMDATLYEYLSLPPDERRASMASLVDEVRFVGGDATLNTHPHGLSDDYGWSDGYAEMLALLAKGRGQ